MYECVTREFVDMLNVCLFHPREFPPSHLPCMSACMQTAIV